MAMSILVRMAEVQGAPEAPDSEAALGKWGFSKDDIAALTAAGAI